MFTGIIQQLGIFRGYGRGKQELIVEVSAGFPTLPLGESVAVDGSCLSLGRTEGSRLAFDISRETA